MQLKIRLSAAERDKLQRMLHESREYVGTVHGFDDKGAPTKFTVGSIKNTKTKYTFHTHNLAHSHGGFDPPSRKDMDILMRGGHRGHFVVARNGIYLVRVECIVPSAVRRSVLLRILALQKRHAPGPRYNLEWMRLANQIQPPCIRVYYRSWRTI